MQSALRTTFLAITALGGLILVATTLWRNPLFILTNLDASFVSEHRYLKLQARNYNVTSDRWIVLTTVAPPTPDVHFLAQISGWQLVVVGDTKTPGNWSHPNCIYLSIEEQRELGFQTALLLPERSYSRKNVGYLFAIAHGAKFIYETDDDNRPLDLLQNFIYSPTTWGLLYDGEHLFNPYRHFGQPTLWPRGYPLASIGENVSIRYRLSHWNTPLIQQGLVNGDPDMDAIFRLTRKKTTTQLNVTFDNNAPPAIVPMGVFSPFNSQNTFFRYDALWALLIPTTTTFRVCDIWRGYWAQRLLWEIGGNLGFFPPNAFQKRNSHSYLSDAMEEKDLYFQTENLINFLSDWKCPQQYSFFTCMHMLSVEMATKHFWKSEDVKLTVSWIRDLEAVGYREPHRIASGISKTETTPLTTTPLPNQKRQRPKTQKVEFLAMEQPLPIHHTTFQNNNRLACRIKHMQSYCPKHKSMFTAFDLNKPLPTYPHILLIIVFNYPHYENINLLETLYRYHFPHIVYCGPKKTTYDKHRQQLPWEVTFIEVDTGNGWFAQNCLTDTMKMNYNVAGYLYIGDDTLLNVWNVRDHPVDRLWFHNKNLLNVSSTTTWPWFNRPDVGLKVYLEAVNASKLLDQTRFSRFFQTLADSTGTREGIYYGGSDIAYVPRRLKDDVIYFMEHFSKFNVFVEMTIPTVFAGIEEPHRIPGSYLWYDGKRDHIEKYFDSKSLFLHPVKLASEYAREKGKLFFCETFFPLTMKIN